MPVYAYIRNIYDHIRTIYARIRPIYARIYAYIRTIYAHQRPETTRVLIPKFSNAVTHYYLSLAEDELQPNFPNVAELKLKKMEAKLDAFKKQFAETGTVGRFLLYLSILHLHFPPSLPLSFPSPCLQ
jgi:hypothetical protein